MIIKNYQSIALDCDGVILNSNKIKTESFYEIALPFGKEIAILFSNFHKKNGGISRFNKIQYLVREILKQDDVLLELNLLKKYSELINHRLIKSEVSSHLNSLRLAAPKSKLLVVSGGEQEELRRLFLIKNIENYFGGHIYGSPKSKIDIFTQLLNKKEIKMPAIYIGDSEYDYFVANKLGLDFVFLYEWTEFDGWKNFCEVKNIKNYKNIGELLI